MSIFTWIRGRPKSLASVAAVGAAAITVTTLALVYDGNPRTEVDLNDGGVWLTNQSSLLVGHFNYQSLLLDGGLRTPSAKFDVRQAGDRVLLVDDEARTMTPVDPARVVLSETVELPPSFDVALTSDTVAIVDREAGLLWSMPFSAVGSFSQATSEPLDELGEGAVIAVGEDGTVYAASTESATLRSYKKGDDGLLTEASSTVLEGVTDDSVLQLAAVGGAAYVLDASQNSLVGTDGFRGDVPADAVLQQSSVDSDTIAVATENGLVTIPKDGSDAQTHPTDGGGQGVAAQPVYVAGCSYGAWSGSGQFVRDCPGTEDDRAEAIEGIDATSVLEFRVNRDVVVLNDVFGGAAWMASASMQRVDNWQDLTPPEGESEEEEEDTVEETVQTTLPERTDVNTPPIAVNDEFGVRPGRTTVLTVLDNDTDADGDILVAVVDSDPAFGKISPIYNGGALQIDVPEDATGSTTFRYTADDGRDGTATATVTLTVRPWSVNSAPVQKPRITAIPVEVGGVASYNVLSDWYDPDGDDIYLSLVSPDGGDEADFTSDGQITYRAIGGVQGRKDMPIEVSDGAESGAGFARYDIRPLGTTDPITNADHVVTRAGQSVSVSPLANDTSTGTEPLRLVRVEPVENATVNPDYADKSFTFVSNEVGTHYVTYLVAAGPNSVPGIVRVDVLPEADDEAPPVAVRDVALLPAGGEVLVNVLGNDTDPAGGVLVVQSVTPEAETGIGASVLGHESVRISDIAGVPQQTRVRYTISNGSQSAEGEIIVIPVPAPERLRPPVAVNDTAVVRVGDVVTIPVLENDYHPNGDELSVAPDLIPPLIDEEDGYAFVSEDTVRFRAGETPGTVNATYEVQDSTGQRAGGYITIRILAKEGTTNAVPRPRDLTARTLSGTPITVPVPLDGIDEDGDSVELVGIDSAPSKGRIVSTGAASFIYEATEGATGTDSFTYRVRDNLGAEATATIRIGIAPAQATNQAPYAVRDAVVMRPNRQIAVPALLNDSDPDGDAFGYAADALEVPSDVAGLDAELSGQDIIITSPATSPLNTSIRYTIADTRGLEASAPVHIEIRDDVPLASPVARDDRVRAEDVDETNVGTLNILENDEDPDGVRSDLSLTLGEGGENASVSADGVLTVPLTDATQLITYTITDRDGLAASAFVRVPSTKELPPRLLSTTAVEVKSGETIELPLAEYVTATGGAQVILTEADKVSALNANGAPLFKDDRTLEYTSREGYFGADALTFEVTDGASTEDAEGRKATLTIPITVLPPDNQPPTFAGASVDVAPGEEPTTLNLNELAKDPDPGDTLEFRVVSGVPSGLTATIDGGVLSVSAEANTPKGTRAPIEVTVTDGNSDPVTATITVTVTASTRQLATVNDDVIAESDQGSTESVNVLANDVSPFPDAPLTVRTAAVESGGAGVQVSVDGDTVNVTSPNDFVGTIVVRYSVLDKTEDADRAVEGRIRITVQGRPDAPGKPTVSSVQSRLVVLSWSAPIDNGTPITGYTVRSTAGGTWQCATTTCTIDGLTNNVEYNFTVTATNRVGESDPSVASETARPDVRPDTPQPPTLVFGDRSLQVNWVAPRTEGSPVETYTLEISPAPSSGIVQRVGVSGTTMKWEGLDNGVSYQVRIRAHNRAPEPSEWSGWSAGEVPAAPPSAAAAPTTQRLDPVGNRAQLRVNWNAPATNGDAIKAYELVVLRGGSTVRTVPVGASQTTQVVELDTSTASYTFQVRAQNKAGWGEYSPQSTPTRAFTAPGAPTGVSASEGNNTVDVSWTPGAANGANANEIRYEYKVNNGGWRSDWASGGGNGATSGRIGNGQVNNNGTYTIQVRPVVSLEGTTYTGAASASSNSVAPYGPIGNPSASASANNLRLNFSWQAPARNGRDITTQIRIGGGSWETVGGSGSRSVDVGPGESRTIEVRTSTSAGQTTTASATAKADETRVWVTQGSPRGNCVNGCRNFVVNTKNFQNGGNERIQCWSSNSGQFSVTHTVNLPENGQVELECHVGRDGQDVWVDILGWGGSVDTEKQHWPRP